ncbi:heparinase II/III domain-containing protein [Actinocatenispora rupis]|nr:heparinase II/III family protein [Actinocatenispora rupis]
MTDVVLPAVRGGWWHAYVCPAHGTELAHDTLLSGAFPAGGAACPYGCRVDTDAVRGAWAALAHQACARRIRLLAYEEPERAVTLLGEYAERYAGLAVDVHAGGQDWMLRGRLFHQALSDAIWAVSIGHAAWTLAGVPGVEAAVPLLRSVAAAARDARAELVAQGRFDSNYTAWLNAAGAVATGALTRIAATTTDPAHGLAGSARGEAADPARDDAAGSARDDATDPAPGGAAADWLGGEYGVYAHVLAASAADGWEWEASTYYHGFVLRAYLLALRGTDPAALPAAVGERITAMIGAVAGIATDGGILPALHDGPYVRDLTALEWTELCTLADAYTSGAGLAAVGERARREAGPAYDGLDAHLHGWFSAPPRTGSEPDAVPVRRTFADAGLTVLRGNGILALLDHGPHGGSHGHHDKLALYLYGADTAWQPDPGQVPYAHAFWRNHFAGPAVHPAVLVDGVEPAECTARTVAVSANAVTAEVTDAYPGVRVVRHVEAADGYLLDVVTVDADSPVRLALCPAVPVETDGARTRWLGDETLHGWHAGAGTAPIVAYPGPGTADDPQATRTWLDWPAPDGTATFCSVYQAGAATVTGVTLADGVLVVLLADGTEHRHDTETLRHNGTEEG